MTKEAEVPLPQQPDSLSKNASITMCGVVSCSDIILFLFLLMLTLFNVASTVIEFTYYADTFCAEAKRALSTFWLYF